MQLTSADIGNDTCCQLSSSHVLALQNSEIEQLAAIVLTQQQCEPLYQSCDSGKNGLHDINVVSNYCHQPDSTNHYNHIHPSCHGLMDDSMSLSTNRNSLVTNSTAMQVTSTLESPEYLAHRLLLEFGKTRTNYNSLVPRIVEVMRIFRDYGPLRCPIPVVSNLDELLNDDALNRIEQRYPNSLEAGFLVLCTERRALRSGGGGKYYFIDNSGRLVGCHKSDLPSYVEKGVLHGPVLLKNLIFVFILRGVYGLDPRCKSSNPQRLLEFYENLSKEGKVSDIQRLVRVWSMEIYSEPPYDHGFPHCTLLWIKRMHVLSHISKWKHSQWQTTNFTRHETYNASPVTKSSNTAASLGYLSHRSVDCHTDPVICPFDGFPADELRARSMPLPNNSKRRRMSEPNNENLFQNSLYDCWNNQQSFSTVSLPSVYGEANQYKPTEDNSLMRTNSGSRQLTVPPNNIYQSLTPSDIISGKSINLEKLYSEFSDFSSNLEKGDIMDWSVQVIDRLSPPILEAAMYLMGTSFSFKNNLEKSSMPASNDAVKSLRYDIIRILSHIKERQNMTEVLRILLACLLQQQRIEEFLPCSFPKDECDSSLSLNTFQNPHLDGNLMILNNSNCVYNGVSYQSNSFDSGRKSFTTDPMTCSTTTTENDTFPIDHFDEAYHYTLDTFNECSSTTFHTDKKNFTLPNQSTYCLGDGSLDLKNGYACTKPALVAKENISHPYCIKKKPDSLNDAAQENLCELELQVISLAEDNIEDEARSFMQDTKQQEIEKLKDIQYTKPNCLCSPESFHQFKSDEHNESKEKDNDSEDVTTSDYSKTSQMFSSQMECKNDFNDSNHCEQKNMVPMNDTHLKIETQHNMKLGVVEECNKNDPCHVAPPRQNNEESFMHDDFNRKNDFALSLYDFSWKDNKMNNAHYDEKLWKTENEWTETHETPKNKDKCLISSQLAGNVFGEEAIRLSVLCTSKLR